MLNTQETAEVVVVVEWQWHVINWKAPGVCKAGREKVQKQGY
jgi:hypothetical protein